MLASLMLAAAQTDSAVPVLPPIPVNPSAWPHEVDLLTRCQEMTPGVATILIIMGVVYLMFGFQIFKALVMLNAACVGAILGAMLFPDRGEGTLAAVIVGAFAAAAITWPTMKYAVALMGGIFGAALGASVWRTLMPAEHLDLVWAGALTGLILFGLISFILFRGSVMMYTSLQGALMLVFGCLGLIFKYQQINQQVYAHLKNQAFVLPALIFVPAVIGLIFQHHNQTAKPAGGGGGGHGGGGKK